MPALKLAYSCKNVEEKWLNIIVEGLVVEEQLDEETQVLAIDLVRVSVNLEYGQVILKQKLVIKTCSSHPLKNSDLVVFVKFSALVFLLGGGARGPETIALVMTVKVFPKICFKMLKMITKYS